MYLESKGVAKLYELGKGSVDGNCLEDYYLIWGVVEFDDNSKKFYKLLSTEINGILLSNSAVEYRPYATQFSLENVQNGNVYPPVSFEHIKQTIPSRTVNYSVYKVDNGIDTMSIILFSSNQIMANNLYKIETTICNHLFGL